MGLLDEQRQALALVLRRTQALLQRRADAHRRDGVYQPADFPFQRLELAWCRGGVASGFPLHVGHQRRHLTLQHRQRFRAQQLIAHLGHQALVQRLAPHCHGGAAHGRAPVLVRTASVALGIDRGEGRAAGMAAQHARKEGAGDGAFAGARSACRATACAVLHAVPQLLRDDSQLGGLPGLPLALRTLHAAPGARLRVFQPLAAVPHRPADVQPVVQHAQALAAAALQRAHGPGAAARAGRASVVELVDDVPRAVPLGELLEHQAHHSRFGLVDDHAPALAVFGQGAGVAIGPAARVKAAFKLPGQATVGFLAQVVEIQLVHQATGDAHDLASPGLGVVAIGRADDAHAAMLQTLDDCLGLADLAAEPVQPLDDQHVKALGEGVGQQRLAAGTHRQRRGAANAFVSVRRHHMPALAFGPCVGLAELVSDRRFALLVRAVAGVERGSRGHGVRSGSVLPTHLARAGARAA